MNVTAASGIKMSVKALSAKISTSDIEAFFQEKINTMNELANSGEKCVIEVHNSDDTGSKIYKPLFLHLPKTVLINNGNKNGQKRQNSFIHTMEDDENGRGRNKVQLKPQYYRLLQPYFFTPNDVKANLNRKETGINNQMVSRLIQFCTPRICNNQVVVLLNDMTVFGDMMALDGDRQPYAVRVGDKIKKIGYGEYLFEVFRLQSDAKNGKNNKNTQAKIDNMLKGFVNK